MSMGAIFMLQPQNFALISLIIPFTTAATIDGITKLVNTSPITIYHICSIGFFVGFPLFLPVF